MTRRSIVTALLFLAAPLGAEAQPAGRIYQIGGLAPARVPSDLATFREGVHAHGWVVCVGKR